MSNIPEFAPGCFGSALAFKPNEGICTACVFRQQCEPAHQIAFEALRAELGIDTPATRGRPAVVEQSRRDLFERDPSAMTLPKKVQDLIARIDRGNYEVRANLSRNVNPFTGKIPFLSIITELLLRYGKPVTVPVLTIAFVMKLEWQEDTAKAHARIGLAALKHLGIVEQDGDEFTLNKSVLVG